MCRYCWGRTALPLTEGVRSLDTENLVMGRWNGVGGYRQLGQELHIYGEMLEKQ